MFPTYINCIDRRAMMFFLAKLTTNEGIARITLRWLSIHDNTAVTGCNVYIIERYKVTAIT